MSICISYSNFKFTYTLLSIIWFFSSFFFFWVSLRWKFLKLFVNRKFRIFYLLFSFNLCIALKIYIFQFYKKNLIATHIPGGPKTCVALCYDLWLTNANTWSMFVVHVRYIAMCTAPRWLINCIFDNRTQRWLEIMVTKITSHRRTFQ